MKMVCFISISELQPGISSLCLQHNYQPKQEAGCGKWLAEKEDQWFQQLTRTLQWPDERDETASKQKHDTQQHDKSCEGGEGPTEKDDVGWGKKLRLMSLRTLTSVPFLYCSCTFKKLFSVENYLCHLKQKLLIFLWFLSVCGILGLRPTTLFWARVWKVAIRVGSCDVEVVLIHPLKQLLITHLYWTASNN